MEEEREQSWHVAECNPDQVEGVVDCWSKSHRRVMLRQLLAFGELEIGRTVDASAVAAAVVAEDAVHIVAVAVDIPRTAAEQYAAGLDEVLA